MIEQMLLAETHDLHRREQLRLAGVRETKPLHRNDQVHPLPRRSPSWMQTLLARLAVRPARRASGHARTIGQST